MRAASHTLTALPGLDQQHADTQFQLLGDRCSFWILERIPNILEFQRRSRAGSRISLPGTFRTPEPLVYIKSV